MAEVELTKAAGELPNGLLAPFMEGLLKIGQYNFELIKHYANCLADILERAGVSEEQISAIEEQYRNEKKEKQAKD